MEGITAIRQRPALYPTRIVFFLSGFGMAAWAPLVPYVKLRLGIGEGALGVLLLCLGIGSVIAMPLAGAAASRFGCRTAIVVSAALLFGALPFLATAAPLALLAPLLFCFGTGLGGIDVAMNIHAIHIEQTADRPVMSGFHALFSLGGISGAAGVSGLLAVGGPLFAELCVVAVGAAALTLTAPSLLPYRGRGGGPALAIPGGAILAIGLLCFVGFLAEGSVLDWSAVFLVGIRDIEPHNAGLGFAVFSATMAVGRFAGDRIVARLGPRIVIGLGGLCAAGGFTVVTAVPSVAAALFGYALVGVGCSNIVPVLFSSLGRQTEIPENVAVPAITALGYAGILAGPALIGFVAQAFSLSIAFLLVAAMLLAVAAGGRALPGKT